MTGILQALLSFFGVSGSSSANYIEDVFSTYLYTGTGASQTITNGIDLSGKGGLVWVKGRTGAWEHKLTDTVRGATKALISNTTGAETTDTNGVTSFSTTGFVLGSDSNYNWSGGGNYVSWTFREQAKFFDVVTYTGDGTTSKVINHNLGSVPGCIIVKTSSAAGFDWKVWHRVGNSSGTSAGVGNLNTTSTFSNAATDWFPSVTSTTFTVSSTGNGVNNNGNTFVAYLFAHNAGGFGLSGADNVITCGTYLGSNHRNKEIVTLGYEPQWVMIKNVSSAGNRWVMVDNMRGMADTGSQAWLAANSSAAETTATVDQVVAASTGFYFNGPESDINEAGSTFIYIAIRRGPMKVPTSGTSVFTPLTRTGTGAIATVSTTILPDMVISTERPKNVANGSTGTQSRLVGAGYSLYTNSTTAELDQRTYSVSAFNNASLTLTADSAGGVFNYNTASYIEWLFSRAPGFFDVVCYAGSGSSPQVLTHNLTVTPEMMIVKFRDGSTNWYVYHSALGNTKAVYLEQTSNPVTSAVFWNNTSPTSTQFTVGSFPSGAGNYVAYLFATLAGVSKVGSYTGTGTTQVINCGFTAGSRFVLIRRTDSTGDWYVWDSARGIVAGNDPYLLLNSTAAEVTNTDYVDTANSGFEISSTAPAAINANGGTFIFLAIA